MIKINELRIGNWVMRYRAYPKPDGLLTPVVIEELKLDTETQVRINGQICDKDTLYSYLVGPGAFRPIPITHEILVKAGFNAWGVEYIIYNKDLKGAWDQLHFTLHDGKMMYVHKAFGCYRDFNIQYVHQLQNLYFTFTGEELQIDL